jgi:hypothetical protein
MNEHQLVIACPCRRLLYVERSLDFWVFRDGDDNSPTHGSFIDQCPGCGRWCDTLVVDDVDEQAVDIFMSNRRATDRMMDDAEA